MKVDTKEQREACSTHHAAADARANGVHQF